MRTLAQNGIRKCRLLVTGQTTSYVDYDDGYYEKGVAKPTAAYTVLSTGQYSGTTAITINAKTDTHSNNCVLDNNTGLMWSRYQAASVGPGSDGLLPWTTTGSGATAEGIFPYCLAANTASLAGWTDWRIPNLYELLSIGIAEAPGSGPNSTAFPSYNTAYGWTSTTRAAGTSSAMAVRHTDLSLSSDLKTATKNVILVRGG